MQDETVERGKENMRGLIHTHGVQKAAELVSESYRPPFNSQDGDLLAGAILAAYEAGQLDGITNKTERVY